jgi:predicted membrane GTPase involved in stress response
VPHTHTDIALPYPTAAWCRYVGPDELIEVTPAVIRLRKQLLDATQRKLAAKRAAQQAAAEVGQ